MISPRLLLAVEFCLIVFTIVMGACWILDDKGNYEPWTILSGGIVALLDFYRRKYHNKATNDDVSSTKQQSVTIDTFTFAIEEEIVSYEIIIISKIGDAVKVKGHTHSIGLASEYAWIHHYYPNSITQYKDTRYLDISKAEDQEITRIPFDIINVKLPGGREKDIYFDISDFYEVNAANNSGSSDQFENKIISKYITTL